MTLETARAILKLHSERSASYFGHNATELWTFEARVRRLRPRKFVKLTTLAANASPNL